MIFRGEIVGVLAVFRRSDANDACFAWLQTMANAAAVAIANARAFEENESLRHRLEQERDNVFSVRVGNLPPGETVRIELAYAERLEMNESETILRIPLVVAPQLLLSGVIFPVSSEPTWLQAVSGVLPLTYVVDGLRDVMLKGADLSWAAIQLDAAVLGGFCLLMIASGRKPRIASL